MNEITKQQPKLDFKYKERSYQSSDDVAFFSQELYLSKLENKLLGDYNKEGKYVLPTEILKNLTDLKKILVKKVDGVLHLKAVCLTYEFKFLVKFLTPNSTKKVAQLFLVEKLSSVMDEGKEINSLVSNYMDDNDTFFEDKYKKVFSIIEDDEDGKKEENEGLAKALLEKLKFENKVFVNFLLQSRLKDKLYVEKLLKALATDQSGHSALKKYEALLAKYGKTLKPEDKNYYRKLKQLLDEVLEEEKRVLSSNLIVLITRLRQAYVKASLPIVETLKTAVEQKKKDIEKEIKLGKGNGPSKFSYYKGADIKKQAPKSSKKHPDLENLNKKNQFSFNQKDDLNLESILMNDASIYFGTFSSMEKEISSVSETAKIIESNIGNNANKSHNSKTKSEVAFEYQQKQRDVQNKQQTSNFQKNNNKEKDSQKVAPEFQSNFGRFLGE